MIRRGLLFLLLLSAVTLHGQSIEEVNYLPKIFYVGDVVEMRVELANLRAEEIRIPEVLPQAEWLIFRSIDVQPAGEDCIVHILFSSYQPGIRMIPALDLGGVVLSDIRVDTASVLDLEASPLSGTADPLFLPRTGLYFTVLVGLLFSVPLLVIFLFKGIRGRIAAAILNAKRRQPHVRLVRVLKELDRRILNRDGNIFYTTLTDEFRRYLSLRSGEEFRTLTGREAGEVLGALYGSEAFTVPLSKLFYFAEEVKFGGRDPFTSRKREDLNTAITALDGLEHYYHRFWIKETEEKEAADVDNQ